MKWLPLIAVTFLTLWISIQIFQSTYDSGTEVAFKVAGDCPNPALDALTALYNNHNGDNWVRKAWWLDTCDVCLWQGIECDGNGNVVEINMSFNRITGPFPESIIDINTLKVVDLSGNDLGGNIPARIEEMTSLEELRLASTSLTGEIPDEIGNLSSLKVLNLRSNQLTGQIPESIGRTSLEEINLQSNQITGNLPTDLGDLLGLRSIIMGFNQISGEIPQSFTSLTNLVELNLPFNDLNGSLPTNIGDLQNLEVLQLAQNQLSGPIPSSLGAIPGIRDIYLHENELTDSIPTELGFYDDLAVMFLAGNNLIGCIPQSFQNYCGRNILFTFFRNRCLWSGDFEDFCAGEACTFSDYLISEDPTICRGESAEIEVRFASQFQWSTGENTGEITVSPTETTVYYVDFLSNNQCERSDSIVVRVLAPPLLIVTGQNVTISGGADGSASANTIEGTLPYSYTWNTGASTETIENLTAGTYFVTVTDGNGCLDTSSVVITEPACQPAGTPCNDNDPSTFDDTHDGNCNCIGIPCPTLQINLDIADISCHGETDGSALTSPSGGVTPYTYTWSTGATADNIAGLGNGTYSVTVTDISGCSADTTFTLSEPSILSATVDVSDESYPGSNDGSIDLSVQGGNAPYSFLWSDGATIEDPTNLAGGLYEVTITDSRGCQFMTSTSVATGCQPIGTPCNDNDPSTFDDTHDGNCNCIGIPCPTLQINLDIADISCHGETDGSAIASPMGGASPYSYVWSTGATSDNIAGLGFDTYSLTVTDNNGCSVDTTFTLSEPSLLTANASASDESYPGSNDGSIDLSVQRGTPPYSYLWSHGAISEDPTNLAGGLYAVTITDSRGCQFMTSTSVATGCHPMGTPCNDNDPLTFDDAEDGNCNCIGIPCPALQIHLDILDISCHGETDGSAIASPVGGATPYTYAWSTGASANNIAGLGEGTYSLTVTDNNGCSTDTTFILTSPEMLSGSVATTDESLPGAGNGSIDLTVQGGTEPYSFTWSTADTTEDLSNVSGGSYEVTVTDHRGCQLVLSATVNTGCPELIARIVTTDLSCPDDSDGSASIIFTGDGVSPHTRIWSTGSTAHSLNNLPKGLYSVTVTDAIGCSSSMNFEIKAPDLIQLQFNTREESSPGAGDGSIDLTVLGGTPPFEFEWSDGQDTEDIENLQGQGTEYQVTVTDANACTVSGSVTLLTGCLPEGTNCNDNNPSTYNDQEDGNCQCVGIPCSDIAFNATMANPSCSGDPSGSIFISDVFGEGPFTFSWSNGVTTQNNINIAAGQYSLTITDVNGCQVDTSFSLLEPPQLSVEVMITHPSSPTSMDGEIQAVISGGSGDLAILWSTGATGTVVSNLPAAVYSLQIEDELGCQLRDTVVLFSECIEGTPCDDGDANTHSDMLDADCNCLGIPCQEIPVQFQVTPPSCWDAANGSIAMSIEEKVLVEWSTGDTTSSISNLSKGLYSVTITNEDGCQQEEVFSITQPSPLIAMITFDSVSQEAMVAMSGGTSPYEVIWSTGSNQTVVPIGNEPIIFVDVQDVNGCFASDTLYLENDEGCNFFLDEIQPLLDISVGPSNPCGQGGAISFGSSFPDDYRFSIDGGQTYHITPLFESLSSGSYQLLISSSTSDCSFDAGEIEIGSEIHEDWIGSKNVSPCGESGRIFSNLDDLQISLQTDGIWVDAIDNLSAGSYAVYGKFVSDTCVFPITDLTITNFDTSDVIEFIYQDANQCIGTSGSIEILHLEVGYSYSLTNGSIWQEQPRIYEVSPGTYTLMVRTPSGQCEFTLDEQIEVEEIPSLEIENITAQRALACDPENGSITIHTNVPSSTDIEYSVDGGEHWQSQSKIQNLREGPYLVIARTIGSDCADSVEITINSPIEASTIDVAVQDPNNCEDSNGSITIEQLDAELEYRLNNGIWQSDNIFDSLSSGYFQIELRSQDSAACFLSSDSIELMNESLPQIGDVLIHEPTECGALASIEVQTLSINAEFSLDSIFWQSDPLFDNVEDGIYTLYIRNGDETCSQFWDSPIEVALPSQANLQAIQIQNASTCEVADGAIFLQDDGFEYSLDSARTFETVDRFDELSLGKYQLIAKSMETGCLDSLEFQIKGDETSLKPDTVIALDPTCYGGTDGYLEIQFEGNTTVDYQYQWDNGGQANFQGTLPAGNYTLSVTTAPNCVQEFAFELNEPQPIEFEVPVLDSVMICLGEKLPITLTDSTLEYYWYLNNTLVNQGPSFEIAEDGDYQITGVNDIGCETSIPLQVDFSTEVFQANFLVPSMVVAGSPLQAIEISWPIPDYIEWHVEGGEIISTTQNIATLQFDTPGEYSVRLYAENGICMTTVEKTVTVVADSSQLDPGIIPQLSHILNIRLFPNPNRGLFTVDITLREVADIQLRIYNEQSQLILSDQITQTEEWNRPVDLQGLPPGIYTVLVQSLDEWRSVGFVIN